MFQLSAANAWRVGCHYGDNRWHRMEGADWSDGTGWHFQRCPRGHHIALPRERDIKGSLRTNRDQDFRWTRQGANELLVSERILEHFLGEGFTGFVPHPVAVTEVLRPKASIETSPRLFEIRVEGRAFLDAQASGFAVEAPPCPVCGYQRRVKEIPGLYLVPGSWDDRDFFTVAEYPYWILVSDRVAAFVVEHALKPCVLHALEEIPFDVSAPPQARRRNDVERLVRRGMEQPEARRKVMERYALDERLEFGSLGRRTGGRQDIDGEDRRANGTIGKA